ncbi:hypothetical protein QJS10_CPA01g02148 [Acorus calamus]|uniref:Uncharacterized protein n=1 Tax=Acorus calamus TaxID=4465 RepID=A0AAV9FJU3_ACOCL|nr:hypothetical protein QJS10_CPA01g02148 [Acorus calamus]
MWCEDILLSEHYSTIHALAGDPEEMVRHFWRESEGEGALGCAPTSVSAVYGGEVPAGLAHCLFGESSWESRGSRR